MSQHDPSQKAHSGKSEALSGAASKQSITPAETLSYKDAGVDIAAADAFVHRIGALAKSTHGAGLLGAGSPEGRPADRVTGEVVPHTGAYAGLLRLGGLHNLRDPLLAAACDGVGTKLLIARDMGMFEGLGQDLVAMNVNDLLPSGARPLLFLDYIATGKLDGEQLEAVVRGIAAACKQAGCILLGGETAEMPGLYPPGDFDLAGFTVGLADGACLPDPTGIQVGNRLLALPSSGVHSNGLSLARKALLERGGLALRQHIPELGRLLGHELLEPTRIYVQEALALMQRYTIRAAAHITGGGLLGRLEKLARPGQRLVLRPGSYPTPAIFPLIQRSGNVTAQDMARTFNMGLGFVVVMEANAAAEALHEFPEWLEVGEVVAGEQGVELGYAHSA